MTELKQNPVTPAELEAEHQHLHEAVEEWRNWWEQLQQLGQPHFGEMGDKLVTFRNELARHFMHEETSGPLMEIVKSGTRAQAAEVQELWQDHQSMLRDLDQLISQLKTCSEEVSCWTDARVRFEEFLDRLNAHNSVENELLGVS